MKFILQRWIITGFVINLVVVLALGWIADQRMAIEHRLTQLDDRKLNVTLRIERVHAGMNALGNIAQWYTLTGDERYLEFLNSGIVTLRLRELRRWLTGDTAQLNKLSRLELLASERMNLNFDLLESARKGSSQERLAALSEKNRQQIRDTYLLITQIEDDEDLRHRKIAGKLQQRLEGLNVVFHVLLGLAIVLLGTVYFVIRHHLKSRRRAEQDLRENKQLLQSIIDNTSSAVFVKQIGGEYLLANKRFTKMFGPAMDTVTGKTDRQLFSEELSQRLRSSDMDVLKAGKELRFEEIIPQNGDTRIYDMVKFPLRDSSGNAYAIAGIATDVSLDKSEGTLLKESQARFQAIFEAAPDAMIVIDEESKIVKWNPKAEQLFGWKEEEVLSRPMPELIMPERFRSQHYNGIRKFLGTGEGPILNSTLEVTARNRDNQEFEIELTVSSVQLEGRYLFISFIREITKRKQMEAESRRAKSFLDSIIENIPDMIFVKDAEQLRFVRLNKAGEELLGQNRSEMIGKSDYDFFPRAEADFFTSKDREVLNKGELLDIPEEEIDTRQGKRWLHTKKIPILDEHGKPQYLLGISEDITERKELDNKRKLAEKRLRESEASLALILENIGEGVIVCDTSHRVVLFNQTAAAIFETEKMATCNWSDQFNIYYPDGFSIYPAQELPLQRALKGGVMNETDLVLQNADTGKKKLIKVTGHPIFNEHKEVVAAVATIRDVTKFKQLESALRESEIKYRKLIGFRGSRSDD